MRSRVTSQGRITIPKRIRTRYDLTPGAEVHIELRNEGILLRKAGTGRHPIWNAISLGKRAFRWPRGIPHTVDAYIDWVRGGAYEPPAGQKRPRRRNSAR